MKKKVGIFGGTFDPVHFGHLNLAISMMEACALEQVFFVPAFQSPFKGNAPPSASADHRRAMLQLAIAPIKSFKLIDWELQQEGPSYAIDTVRKLAKDSSLELHYLLGQDHQATFHRWKNADELARLAPPLFASREGEGGVAIPRFEISSTKVRERLFRHQYCGHLIPAPVLEYIQHHQLYE